MPFYCHLKCGTTKLVGIVMLCVNTGSRLFTTLYFLIFYSVFEQGNRIMIKLDTSAKQKTWQGRGWGLRKFPILHLPRFTHLPVPTLSCLDVSFPSVCPVIDHKFCHNIVKVAVDPWGNSRVDLQTTLTMLWQFIVNNRTDSLKTDINLFLR